MFRFALLIAASFHLIANCEEYKVPETVDVDQIIKNDRLMKNYVECLLDKGKCTSEGEQLKKTIPEALQNECAKCNDKQKEGAKKVLRHLVKHKSSWWKELEAKYDPNGEYKHKYNDIIKEEGLQL